MNIQAAGGTIAVRPARPADYPQIARIQEASPEAAQWPVGDYSNFNVLVAFSGETLTGFCSWRQTATDEAEVLNLAVDPATRRSGTGSALLQALIREARGDIFLEVAETNVAARALYKKLGWEETAARHGYYSDGNVNAIVMKKSSW